MSSAQGENEVAATDNSNAFQWTEDLTKRFISLRKASDGDFQDGKRAHRNLYEDIGKGLGIQDVQTPAQLRKKWNNLCKKYKEIKNPKTGTGRPPAWLFFQPMDEVLGDNHSITPPVLISSSGGTVAKPLSLSPSPPASPKPKKRRNKDQDLLEVINSNLTQMAETDKQLVKQQGQMINAFERMVNVFERKY